MGFNTPGTTVFVADVLQADRPKLLVVSETRLFGEGLAEALAKDRSLIVCGHCASATESLAELARLKPDIVLLDAAVREGFGLVASMSRVMPELRIVVIALAETSDSVIAWAEIGVAGYIPQTTGLCDVVPILLGIIAGEQVCSRSVAAGLFRRLRDLSVDGVKPSGAAPRPALTAREMQIVDLISAGLSNKQIARQLNIGVATTKSHVHNLLGKLEVQRRGQAVGRLRGHQDAASPNPARS
jgi:two-component system nitrate/nitrite response regulator NarL